MLKDEVKQQHRLSEKDIDSLTAVCAVCGPVSLRTKRNRASILYMCVNNYLEMRRRSKRSEAGRKSSRTASAKYQGMVLDKSYDETLAEFLEIQNGCCPLCLEQIELGRGKHALDHCHKTGKPRGVLCAKCNYIIANHSSKLLERAVIYVKKYEDEP